MIGSQLDETITKPIAVSTEGIHKSYRSGATVTPVLEGVDLVIRREQCVFLAGPSGSGKTTLLSILGCILSPDQGRVQILDQDISTLDEQARTAIRRNRIGFVFQRFHLIRGLTSLENVCVPLTLQGMPHHKAASRAADLLDAVGLSHRAHTHSHNLSSGECQRVALARALSADPDLVLADEPTASLDATNGQEVMKLLRRLTTEEGRTAIIVTHDQRIFPFADKVFHLENGRIAETAGSTSTALLESER
ncbi:MAG: ABC transporter ATP-binding protein [Pirellulales bacterium]|nr:ABC transporter ATP-binding protein [Pirellulales bacterium]